MNSAFSPEDNPLPRGLNRPIGGKCRQLLFFDAAIGSVAATLRVSLDDMKRWHELRWLSFNPATEALIDHEQIEEIRFLRNVVRSGLPDAYLSALLKSLPKPVFQGYNYLAYSFKYGWVVAEPVYLVDVDEAGLEAAVEELFENEDMDALVELRQMVDSAIAKLNVATNNEEE